MSLPGMPIPTWGRFEEEVKALGYDLYWHRSPYYANRLHICKRESREGVDLTRAFEREIHTRSKHLLESKKEILSSSHEILKDLKERLIRVERIFPIAKAVLLLPGKLKPTVMETYIEIVDYPHTIQINDDLTVEVLCSMQLSHASVRDLEDRIATMTATKEEYQTHLKQFLV